MSFQDLALPLIKWNIPVFPLVPGKKVPIPGIRFLREATTDSEQIARWNREDADYNIAMLATDEFCFLEFDIHGGMEAAAKEMRQTVPVTRTQKSGGGFDHFIFRHTDRSRALGNRSVNLAEACTCGKQDNRPCLELKCRVNTPHHHHEWFSFRGRNKYLVGGGSLHPSGNYYETLRDIDPNPVLNWVLDYVEKHSDTPTLPSMKDTIEVSEDFEFDEFCEFYDISILGTKDDVWQVVEECPGVGYRHEHSRLTGFYYDGSHLGWSCFAQMCPTEPMRIGELIAFMNKEKGESYPGVIWDKESDEDLFGDDVEMVELDEIPLYQPKLLPAYDPKAIPTFDQMMEILGGVPVEPVAAALPEADEQVDSTDTWHHPERMEDAKTEHVTIDGLTSKIVTFDKEPGAEEVEEIEEEEEATEAQEREDGDTEEETEYKKSLKIAGQRKNEDGDIYALIVRSAADIKTSKLKWLWEHRFPLAKINLMTGKPGCGKSTVCADITARVTTGNDWPDGRKNTLGPRKVLIAASEDDPSDTLVPRLMAAGADLENVLIIPFTLFQPGEKKKRKKKSMVTLDLKRDAKLLLDTVKANPDIALLILDPITSFFGEADQNRDKEVRPLMDAISDLCRKSGITVIGLIHENKRSDVGAMQKVLGASSIPGSARAVWGFYRDSEDKSKHTMAYVKGNLSRRNAGLEYTIEETMVEVGGEMTGVPRIVWGAETEMDADDVMNQEKDRAREHKEDGVSNKKVEKAIAIITAAIPGWAREIYALGEKEGISGDTMKRAYKKMGVIPTQPRGSKGWWWSIPKQEQTLEGLEDVI
jgi:putative DNA primase/helicase